MLLRWLIGLQLALGQLPLRAPGAKPLDLLSLLLLSLYPLAETPDLGVAAIQDLGDGGVRQESMGELYWVSSSEPQDGAYAVLVLLGVLHMIGDI